MMKQPTVRPAMAAIAAVLALASTPLMAQVAAPTAPPPIAPTQAPPAPAIAAPATAPAAAPAAPAPVMAAPSPVVQPTPAAPPVVAEAAPEAAPAPREAPARAAKARTVSARTETATPRTVAPAAAPEATAPAAPVSATPVVAQNTAPEVAATPEPTQNVASDTGNGLEWGLAGGAVVLLAGLGFMATRRRRRPEQDELLVTERVPAIEPAREYVTESAVVDREPAMVAPAFVAPRAAPAMAKTGGHGSLETAAAQSPTADNPFLTRKNRLRRAHFMQRQSEVGTPYAAPAAAAPVAPAQEQRRPAPVYDFGGGMVQRRGFRPATT